MPVTMVIKAAAAIFPAFLKSTAVVNFPGWHMLGWAKVSLALPFAYDALLRRLLQS